MSTVTLRRKLAGALLTVTALTAVGVAGATPASAEVTLEIESGDSTWTYLGQYWYWYAPDGQWYLTDAYAPPVGGGRGYCWAGTTSCWFESFAPIGNAAGPWLY